MAQGQKTWGQKAITRAKDILESHRPQEIPADARQSLDQIRERALETLAGTHMEA